MSTDPEIVRPQCVELGDCRGGQRSLNDGIDGLLELLELGDADHARGEVAVAQHEAQGGLRRAAVVEAECVAYRGGTTYLVLEIGVLRDHEQPLGTLGGG